MPEVQREYLQKKVMTRWAFKGHCREAFELYESVLGGKIAVMNTFGGSDAKLPPGSTASAPDHIRLAEIQSGDDAILGNDAPAQDYKPPQGFNIASQVNPAVEVRRIFNALSDGGSAVTPLSEVAWSSAFGIVNDYFARVVAG